jgi:hypothetical protein
MANAVRKISMSLKMLLGFLFTILFLTECLDGFHDISDWAVSLFVIIMLNDIYVHLKLYKGEKVESWTLSERSSNKIDKKKKYLLYSMNFLFFSMIIGSVFMESLILSQEVKDAIYKSAIVIWSGVFLASNLYHLKEKFRLSRLVVTNVALMFLLGSLTLI